MIHKLLRQYLLENLQQAEKLYFSTGKIDSKGQSIINRVTHGDNYTRIISEFYILIEKWFGYRNVESMLKELYWDLRNYNKFLPIKGLENINTAKVDVNTIFALEARRKIIEDLNKLPSIARRNFPDKNKPRNSKELKDLKAQLEYFMGVYSLLNNRPPEVKEKIDKKLFRSGYSVQDWINFIEDKETIFNEQPITKEYLLNIIDNGDANIVYDSNNIWVVEVYSPYTIQELGCNSFWCFTYGHNLFRNWSDYSTDDMVYLIVDFNEDYSSEDFMYVLIKPIDEALSYYKEHGEDNYDEYDNILYNMSNMNIDTPIDRLISLLCRGIDQACFDKIEELFNFE